MMSLRRGAEYAALYVARVVTEPHRQERKPKKTGSRSGSGKEFWPDVLDAVKCFSTRDGWHGIAPPVSRGGDRFDLDQCSWSKVGGSNLGRLDDDRASSQGRRVKCASPTQKTVTEHFHSFFIGR
jgi:hypothetical protein